jgi:hypothetical protein
VCWIIGYRVKVVVSHSTHIPTHPTPNRPNPQIKYTQHKANNPKEKKADKERETYQGTNPNPFKLPLSTFPKNSCMIPSYGANRAFSSGIDAGRFGSRVCEFELALGFAFA